MNVVAIVQARLGSSRLPGKVLMDLGGRTVLEWVVSRLARARSLTSIVVATTDRPGDDPIVELCAQREWLVFRGSETDLLDRYYRAAMRFGADAVVRVTSDCPLIDPELVDAVVESLTAPTPVDYVSNTLEPRTFPRGLDVEAFTFDALERAWREDSNTAWREHVTLYFYRNPDRFRVRGISNETDLSGLRWTVDTSEDLQFLRCLSSLAETPDPSWRQLVTVVEQNPEILRINQDVTQKLVP